MLTKVAGSRRAKTNTSLYRHKKRGPDAKVMGVSAHGIPNGDFAALTFAPATLHTVFVAAGGTHATSRTFPPKLAPPKVGAVYAP